MRTGSRLGAAALGALALAAAGPVAATTELVTNGGFETGDFTGWNAGFSPGHNLCCYSFASTGGSKVKGGSDFIFGTPIAGSFSAFGDWDGGLSTDYDAATDLWIRQLLTKTSDVTSATLSFSFNVAGGADHAYLHAYQGYDEVLPRTVTANFLDTSLNTQANLYSFARPVLTGGEPLVYGQQNVTLDVTSAFNALADGHFVLDFTRVVPQYFTSGGYFVLDSVSLQIGDAVADPPPGSDAPEPESWALMILGFAGAGMLLRNRRRVAVS
jgi:hypothetical protein